MRHCLFLFTLVCAIIAIKAVPLRIQKRATFYVANETACVVNDIVYSNGEAIPSEDPCERCKCRPPGFACNKDECRPKPGCRAIRQVGQCCPKYECGCEHNGRMYRDGEQIRDEKNPCYECHCQGSSIACAFVDCFFRVDCIPVYVPGQCCPSYKNCSRDVPEKTSLDEDTALKPGNLLPGLYGESILAKEPTYVLSEAPKQPDPIEHPIVITNAPEDKYISKEPLKTELSETKPLEENLPSESKTEEKTPGTIEILVPEEKKDIKINENVEDIADKNAGGEENILMLNSEHVLEEEEKVEFTPNEIKEKTHLKEESEAILAEEKSKVVQTTTTSSVPKEEPTEKYSDAINTEISVDQKPVQNSAADNSKSLKLSEDENKQIAESSKEEDPTVHVQNDKSKLSTGESVTKAEEIVTVISVEPSGNVESSNDPKSTMLQSQDDKVVKKESAETVTIVVHVREKTKSSTEKDISISTTTKVPISSTKESLIKSNDKLENMEASKDSINAVTTPTDKNFEIFATSTDPNEESSTSRPNSAKDIIEARSDDLTSEQKVTTEKSSNLKSDGDTTAAEHLKQDNVEASKEEITDDVIVEETKEDPKTSEDKKQSEEAPQSTEFLAGKQKVEIKPTEELKSTETPSVVASEILKSEALTGSEEERIQIEETKELTDKVQHEPNEELELKAEPKSEETVEKIEAKEQAAKSEETKVVLNSEGKLTEELKLADNLEVPKTEKKEDQIEEKNESPKLKENDESSKSQEKVESSKVEISTPEERELLEEVEPNLKVENEERIEEPKQDKNEELKPDKKEEQSDKKIGESKPNENVEPELKEKLDELESKEKSELNEKSEESKFEEKLDELNPEEPKLELKEAEPKATDKIVESTEESKDSE